MTGAAAAEVLVSETSLTQDEAARARQLKIARTRDGGVHTGQRESQYAETATLHACLGYRNGSRTQQRSKRYMEEKMKKKQAGRQRVAKKKMKMKQAGRQLVAKKKM